MNRTSLTQINNDLVSFETLKSNADFYLKEFVSFCKTDYDNRNTPEFKVYASCISEIGPGKDWASFKFFDESFVLDYRIIPNTKKAELRTRHLKYGTDGLLKSEELVPSVMMIIDEHKNIFIGENKDVVSRAEIFSTDYIEALHLFYTNTLRATAK